MPTVVVKCTDNCTTLAYKIELICELVRGLLCDVLVYVRTCIPWIGSSLVLERKTRGI